VEGGEATDDGLSFSVGRLLTPTLEIGGDTTWVNRQRSGFSSRDGFFSTHLLVKTLLYESDPHETLITGSFVARIGGLGSNGVGSGALRNSSRAFLQGLRGPTRRTQMALAVCGRGCGRP
jgi:hypothetical protein